MPPRTLLWSMWPWTRQVPSSTAHVLHFASQPSGSTCGEGSIAQRPAHRSLIWSACLWCPHWRRHACKSCGWHAGRFGFVEMRTEELASSAMAMDKVDLCGRSINVGRPKGYVEPPQVGLKVPRINQPPWGKCFVEALQTSGLCPVPQRYTGHGAGTLMLRMSWLLACSSGPWSVRIGRGGMALTGWVRSAGACAASPAGVGAALCSQAWHRPPASGHAEGHDQSHHALRPERSG